MLGNWLQSFHTTWGSLFFRSTYLIHTYQPEPHIGLHDLVLLILQRIRYKDGSISRNNCIQPCENNCKNVELYVSNVYQIHYSVGEKSKGLKNWNRNIALTTLMSWMKANPKETSTFSVIFSTGRMSLLYPRKRSRTKRSSSWEHQPG